MQRLGNRKLILEVLEDDKVEDGDNKVPETESPIESPSEPVKLTDGEQTNFIVSVLSYLNTKVLDIFNYLTPYITGNNEDQYISGDNASLLQSIYADVSLILGKVTQGIKDNSPEPAQQAIDDGQTSTQETITPEVDLKEDLSSDKEKLWDDLMADVDMGDFLDNMQEGEEEEKEKFLKDPKKELQNWKEYYKDSPEMLGKIKAFEDKYCRG